MGEPLNPRLALVIGGAAAIAFGVPLFAFPAAVLASSGLLASGEAISLARGAGATLIGLGVIDAMARNATGDVLRALLAGNLVVQGLSSFVNASAVISGQLPAQAAGASAVHLILGAIFVLALRRLRSA